MALGVSAHDKLWLGWVPFRSKCETGKNFHGPKSGGKNTSCSYINLDIDDVSGKILLLFLQKELLLDDQNESETRLVSFPCGLKDRFFMEDSPTKKDQIGGGKGRYINFSSSRGSKMLKKHPSQQGCKGCRWAFV